MRRQRPAVSVVLVRENAEQLTGSGCCGKLEGESALLCGDGDFAHLRQQQERLGILHRAIRSFFDSKSDGPGVSVITVDPRNQLYLIPKLWADVWAYRPGFGAGLKTMVQFFSLPAVIVNGRVISRRGRLPDPDAVCHVISMLLAGRLPDHQLGTSRFDALDAETPGGRGS